LAGAVELKASELARLDWRENDAGPSLNSLVGMDHGCTFGEGLIRKMPH